jgi:hypothetical protein
MNNWYLPDWNYNNISNITEWSQCQLACYNDIKCLSWTFLPNNTCFLKSGIVFGYSSVNHISGIKQKENNQQVIWIYINRTLSQRDPYSTHGLYAAPLWLKSTTRNNQWFLQLNIFIDHSIIEIFEPQDGRFSITARVYPEDINANNFALYVRQSTGDIILNTIDAWNLTSIWT